MWDFLATTNPDTVYKGKVFHFQLSCSPLLEPAGTWIGDRPRFPGVAGSNPTGGWHDENDDGRTWQSSVSQLHGHHCSSGKSLNWLGLERKVRSLSGLNRLRPLGLGHGLKNICSKQFLAYILSGETLTPVWVNTTHTNSLNGNWESMISLNWDFR